MLAQLHLHLGLKIGALFGDETFIIRAKVARLIPELVHLRIIALWNGPYALSLTLMAFSILFDALFDLAFVQPRWGCSFGLLALRLRRSLLCHLGTING